MKKIIPALIYLLLAIPCQAGTITVDGDGPADFNNIQAAIDAAMSGDAITVADGIYTGPNNRNLNFNSKAITLKNQNGAETCIIDCEKQGRGFYFRSNEGKDTIVDGFTITNGSEYQGGGVYCYDGSSPTITNCIIKGNSADSYGGGLYCSQDSSPIIANCTFIHNSTNSRAGGIYCGDYSSPTITNCTIQDNSGGLYGGGVYCRYYAAPEISNCIVQYNSADSDGGGIYCGYNTQPTITNCIIRGNSADYEGGAIYCSDCRVSITDCTIAGNSANYYGGGISLDYDSLPTMTNCVIQDNFVGSVGGGIYCYRSSPTITNCTFNGNSANHQGGALYCGYEASPIIANSIFSNNSADSAIYEDYSSSKPVVEYCLFSNNTGGDYYDYDTCQVYTGPAQINALPGAAHNISGDPSYAFPDDAHLMHDSACINGGTNDPPGGLPQTDKDGNPRVLHGGGHTIATADIGAYEYNSEQPSIALSPSTLEFIREQNAPNPESQSLQIRNCGGGLLNWQIDEDHPWLVAQPAIGDSTDTIDSIVVSVDTEGLPRGIYTSVLKISDANAVNSPRSVWVTLRIKGTLYVPSEYHGIQEAIDAAMDGETIIVASGTYSEFVNINRQLELKGIDLPVIDANGTGRHAVTLSVDNCTLEGFMVMGGSTGVRVDSSNNTISSNNISNNNSGIELTYASGNNTLDDNEIINNKLRGLYLNRSGGNLLRRNNIAGSPVNFEVNGSSLSEYEQDIDISNTVDSRPVYYLVGADDVVIDSASNAGCVVVVNCFDIVVSDLTLSNNGTGVLFAYTQNSNIENVTAVNNSRAGILLRNSIESKLVGNSVSNNNYGIQLLNSSNGMLRSNACADNLYDFVCDGDPSTDYQHDIDISNTLDGRPIYYLVGQHNATIDSSSNAACVFAVDCSNISVLDLIVSNNSTGVAFVGTSDSSIENVSTTDNSRAGILLLDSPNSTLRDSNILRNPYGIELSDSSFALLENNSICGNGLGVSCSSSSLTMVNSVLKNNSDEGGVAFYNRSSGSISNCTICGNSFPYSYSYSPYGGGISCDYYSDVTISNSVLWANRPNQVAEDTGAANITVRYCDVQGQFPGTGNIDKPPLLTPDGHLCAGSPCINKGDPHFVYTNQDMDGEARIHGATVDMGADEYVDTDADALPDWWEGMYFDPNGIAAEPTGDPDGDGHTNLLEYEYYSSDPTMPCMTYFVDANQPDDSNDGQSWETAKKTIQAAIECAENSDKVLIAPGFYPENISTSGRELIIQSTDPIDAAVVASTVVNGQVSITAGESRGCTIDGLAISSEDDTGILCGSTSPTIRNCAITANRSSDWEQGGGITCSSASPTITDCLISGNVAPDRGGALHCEGSSPTVSNCVISGNIAGYGGNVGVAIYLSDSDLRISHCTLANNEYPEGSYSTYGSAVFCEQSSLQISNSTLWNNVGSEISGEESSVTLEYSDVRGGRQGISIYWEGRGNISVDPCFVETGYWTRPPYYSGAHWIDGDYHLKSEGWRWMRYVAHGSNWIWDGVTSLCIDAGNPGSELGDEPITVPSDPYNDWGRNIRVNMGAYGGTHQASMAPYDWTILGDLTNDGAVNFADVARWADDSSENSTECPGDLDKNAVVCMTDLALLVQDWLAQTCWCGTVVPIEPPDKSEIPSPPLPKGRGCFPADTPVWVGGALVQISKASPGRAVGGVGCAGTPRLEQIEKLEEHEGTWECRDITLENGNRISVVDAHCFMLESGQWIAAQDLKCGLELKTLGSTVRIRSVATRAVPFVGRVYNLKVEGGDRYLVGTDGLIVRDY